jgi:hypothetical protein
MSMFNAQGNLNAGSVKEAFALIGQFFAAQDSLPEVTASVQMTEEEQDEFIQRALYTDSGKYALAAALPSPIRQSLDYKGIIRRVLETDSVGQGVVASYDFDVNVQAIVVSENGGVPESRIISDRRVIPPYTIMANPTVRIEEIQRRRFNIIDRAVQKARIELAGREDKDGFAAINAAAQVNNVLQDINDKGLLKSDLLNLKTEVDQHDLLTEKFLLNIRDFNDMLKWGSGGGQGLNGGELDPVSQREVLQSGILAKLWGADIMVSKLMPAGNAAAVAGKSESGMLSIFSDVNVLPADEPKQLKLGWVVYESIGISILVPNGVAWGSKSVTANP